LGGRCSGLLSDVERAVRAIRAGEPAVIPTDTVYGLVCDAEDEVAAERLYMLKGRPERQPSALMAVTVDELSDRVPGLPDAAVRVCRALLPGAFTLVLPNPSQGHAWICGDRPQAIGVRVPPLAGPAADVLRRVRAVVSTSANLPGGPDPRRLADVPAAIRAGAATVDGGELPGTPSTVLDLTGPEPVVLREGAVPAATVLARLAAAGER
jgi:L-threonylcarbamoyladenylate synthase